LELVQRCQFLNNTIIKTAFLSGLSLENAGFAGELWKALSQPVSPAKLLNLITPKICESEA
jgi:hypothetical protein